jgi:hypothetical protein
MYILLYATSIQHRYTQTISLSLVKKMYSNAIKAKRFEFACLFFFLSSLTTAILTL